MARTTPETEAPDGDPANAWLETHTLQDIRALAQELSDAGEDVSELVDAVNELEQILSDAGVASEAGT